MSGRVQIALVFDNGYINLWAKDLKYSGQLNLVSASDVHIEYEHMYPKAQESKDSHDHKIWYNRTPDHGNITVFHNVKELCLGWAD